MNNPPPDIIVELRDVRYDVISGRSNKNFAVSIIDKTIDTIEKLRNMVTVAETRAGEWFHEAEELRSRNISHVDMVDQWKKAYQSLATSMEVLRADIAIKNKEIEKLNDDIEDLRYG